MKFIQRIPVNQVPKTQEKLNIFKKKKNSTKEILKILTPKLLKKMKTCHKIFH